MVFKSIEKSDYFAKLPRTGRPTKFLERVERAPSRIAHKSRFSTVWGLKSAACAQFPEEDPSKYLVRRIVRYNGLKSCKRKQKPFRKRKLVVPYKMGKDNALSDR